MLLLADFPAMTHLFWQLPTCCVILTPVQKAGVEHFSCKIVLRSQSAIDQGLENTGEQQATQGGEKNPTPYDNHFVAVNGF
jgi:hypothetical protein